MAASNVVMVLCSRPVELLLLDTLESLPKSNKQSWAIISHPPFSLCLLCVHHTASTNITLTRTIVRSNLEVAEPIVAIDVLVSDQVVVCGNIAWLFDK